MLRKIKFHSRQSHRFLIPFICFLIIAAVFDLPRELRHHQSRILAQSVQVTMPSSSPTPSPSPSPSPSPQPSAAVEQLSGFCLNVPVIFYHHIEPLDQAKTEGHAALTVNAGVFEKQMAYLNQAGYTTISLDQLVNALAGHQHLGGKVIVITIDDGYQDLFTYAFPIIQKYHITTSLAIATGLVNNSGYITWDQLKQMVGSGQVSTYDHTWSHASLPVLSTSKAQYEIATGKQQLQANLGQNSNVFVYPYGSTSTNIINLLKSNGFMAAFATTPGITQCDSNIFSLHRTRIGNSALSSYGL